MKKIFAMLTAILLCGAMMTSCNKENKNENPQGPTKADLVGTWEGTYSGTTLIEDEDQNVNYTITWTLTMNPEGSPMVGSLSYKLNLTGYEEINRTVNISSYDVRQNTYSGYIILAASSGSGILDNSINFDIDLKAKTLSGTFQAFTSGASFLGGETILHKK
ncbi:MAG: hypothetical protein IJM74_06900 [Bacteroidales bacterium]|jgi:hypothetical protein|nr:hypothetical protein [Bacteroidales bacterium]